jgi:hypothetical protein
MVSVLLTFVDLVPTTDVCLALMPLLAFSVKLPIIWKLLEILANHVPTIVTSAHLDQLAASVHQDSKVMESVDVKVLLLLLSPTVR